jgi:nitrate/nitrite transporter NarK
MNEVSGNDDIEPPEELRKLSESKTPAEAGHEKQLEEGAPYSSFTNPQKLAIVLLVAFAGVFSPLSSFIYYPALEAIAKDLHTSLSKINLTITSYMVVSAVAPTVWGDMADRLGRRSIFLFMFLVYIAANIGLSLQNSYSALLVLRMVQSAGGSGEMLFPRAYNSVCNGQVTD